MLTHTLGPPAEVILDCLDTGLRVVLRNVAVTERGRVGRRLVLIAPPLGPHRCLVRYPAGGVHKAWTELVPLAEPYALLRGTLAAYFPDVPAPWTFLLPRLEFDDRVSLIRPTFDSLRLIAKGTVGDDILVGLDVRKSIRIARSSAALGPSVAISERLAVSP